LSFTTANAFGGEYTNSPALTRLQQFDSAYSVEGETSMAQATRMFRIFISSTFSDLQAERNALQERVWPRLRDLCQRHGARFQAVDLRWGVSEDASLDQQAMAICLDEIARCQRVSKQPDFLVLLGDRYGSRLLPQHISQTEFDELARHLSPEDRDALTPWYRLDQNAQPPAMVLQPRTGRYDDRAQWAPEEDRLRRILERAVAQTTSREIPEAERAKYTASATEQEIIAGALEVADAGEHVHCFFRSITNLDDVIAAVPGTNALPDEQRKARNFVDVNRDGELDTVAQGDLAALKKRLRERLPPGNIHTYEARWTDAGITTDHLDQLCKDVYATLAGLIEPQLTQAETIGEVDRETAAHQSFGEERRHAFEGRDAIRQTIARYLRDADLHPLIIHGTSGVGKSALLAQVSAEAREQHPAAVLLTRYIGATPESADARALLLSLCREISRRYGADESAIPSNYDSLIQEFPQRLALATDERPLLLFLDALDQLGDGQQPPNLSWLPTELPHHVRLVATIRSDGELTQLQRLPAGSIVELERMSRDEGDNVLKRWLAEAHPRRVLQPPQRSEVLDKFAVHGLPLYLRLAFEEARRWHSYAPAEKTVLDSVEIPGIIQQLFTRLGEPANHGAVLVARGLGYLSAAKNGLSEDELLDVLSTDSDVLHDFRARSPNSPRADRLPVVIWSRLYFDLEPYLTERSAEGATTLAFYHRELGDVVQADYLSGENGIARHGHLATYFAWPDGDVDGATAQNLRRMAELPYQQTMGEQWDAVFATLTNFRFLEQKAAHLGVMERTDAQRQVIKTYTGVYLLQDDYDLALRQMPPQ
jgi:hypothetical protein